MAQRDSGREVKLLVQAGINLDSVDTVSTKNPSLFAFYIFGSSFTVEHERMLRGKIHYGNGMPIENN